MKIILYKIVNEKFWIVIFGLSNFIKVVIIVYFCNINYILLYEYNSM